MDTQTQPTNSKNDAGIQQQQVQQRQRHKSLWITHVSAIGPFLKVCGQLKPMWGLSKLLKKEVLPSCNSMHSTWSLAEKRQQLSLDRIYLVKSMNRILPSAEAELLRVRMKHFVETIPPQPVLLVEVYFIDMGYSKIIDCEEILMAPQDNELMKMPALGSSFILQGIFGDWTPQHLEDILRLILYQTVLFSVEKKIEGYEFVKVNWKNFDLAQYLMIQRKLGSPISPDCERDYFSKVLKEYQKDLNNYNIPHFNDNNNIRKHNNNIDLDPKKSVRPLSMSGNVMMSPLDEANAIKKYYQQQHLVQQKLLREQMQQNYIPGMIVPNIPRLPQNMTNDFHTYMMGIHRQNNRMPLSGHPLGNPIFNLHKASPTALRVQRPVTAISPTKAMHTPQLNNNDSPYNKIRKSLPNTGYKINKFTVGHTYDVSVSFVEKGPYMFLVQQLSAQEKLTKMMNQIEKIELKNLSENMTSGMACIARYSEDAQLYRALVVSAQDSSAQVIYVDYGNSAFLKKADLYEIPSEFMEECAFALPFALAGLKSLGPVDDSLKKAFKEMVIFKQCGLKVTPAEGPPVVQYCELYMQEKNILHVLQEIQKSRLVYPKAVQLSTDDVVEIRFIDSPNNFYVQNVLNINDFEKLMDDMFIHYNANQNVPHDIVVGVAYAVKTDADWYRAEVIRADEQAIIVRLVDFGYERMVTRNLLSTISEKHLKMPRQAVHCCLKGFESNELNNIDLATTQFEMLAEDSEGPRRSFCVKVFRVEPDDLHIVNLFTKELNVMKKLYKLSMPFEQYLTLEKEDFHMNGHNNSNNNSKRKSKDDNNKAYSTSSSTLGDEQSSYQSKKSSKNSENHTKDTHPVSQTQQTIPNIKTAILPPLPILLRTTPAQRLQLYRDPTKCLDWEITSTASSTNTRDARSNASDARSNTSDKQKIPEQQRSYEQHLQLHQQQQQQQQQNQQQLGRKHNELLNSSFDSTDRRSDASSNSNRSRANNAQRQKERRNKETPSNQKSPRSQKQQQEERSQNAPQGYSQSRRGSTDSLYGVEITVATSPQQNKPVKPEEYMPLSSSLPVADIKVPFTEEVQICWWVSPHQFYTHPTSRAVAFSTLMTDIHNFYKKKPVQQLQLKPESLVIARHRKDNMFYRGRVVSCNHMLRRYKVNFIDFGSHYTVSAEDIWQIERRFVEFPIMAYFCSLRNIVSNYDHLYIVDRMVKYIPNGAKIICDYKERVKNIYYVDVKVNNAPLLERLKNDGLVTEISSEISIELLAGQQICAKIFAIKNMLNFKIQIEGCDAPLLSSYDDVRFVKSNPDIVQKFKQFYDGKTCMVYVKDVNDNKVVLLRPVLPLFREETVTYISSYPRIWYSFKGTVVFISNAHRLFIHPQSFADKMSKLLDEMFAYYESQGSPLTSYEIGKVCAAKSSADDNWYRARILKSNKDNTIEAYYVDYGNTEILNSNQLKVLLKRFYKNLSAYAVEVNLPLRLVGSKSSPKKAEELTCAVMEQLRLHLEEQTATVQPIYCRKNHLIGEIITENGQNMLDILKEKNLIKGRDLEYMTKQLENDKMNVFELIETVDLTQDDEDESNVDKRQPTKSSKVSSPRKKKINNNDSRTSSSSKNSSNDESSKVKNETDKIVELENIAAKQQSKQNKSVEAEKVSKVKRIDPISEPIVTTVADPEISKTVEDTAPVNEQLETINNDLQIKEEINESVTASATESPVLSSSLEDFGDMEEAVLSHCDTPAQFFVHPLDKIDQLRKLQEDLQIVASCFPPLMNVYNGSYCISNYSVDKQWYRAQIIDAELMAIKFIDFGNTDCLSDASDVKEMSVFPDIEPLCIPCALPIRPNGTADWADSANAIFNESYSKTLFFTYITQGDHKKPSYINLYIDGVNIAKKLIEDGFAKPLELVDSGVDCYISHVNGLSDFYIQYEKDSKALELIEIYLSGTEELPKIVEFTKGKIVAAQFNDDGNWYRAKLLKQLEGDNGFEVLFIDYGNTSTSKECREISEEIASLPPLSKKCALDICQYDFFGWSDAAEKKFLEITTGDTIFNVELRAPAIDHAVVYLYIDNVNINPELEALCMRRNPDETKTSELNASFGAQSVATIDINDASQMHNGIVSHSISPECFYVQFEKDSARLEDLKNTLNISVGMDTVKENVQIGQLYATVYDDDNQLYRARVLKIKEVEGEPSYTVIFVDYGNEAIVTELRALPHDLEQMREFCYCCALKGVKDLIADDATITDIFHNIVDQTEGVVRLNFEQTQSEKGVALVNLYTPTSNESFYDQIVNKIQENNKLKPSSSTSSSKQCLISHAVTPYEFYIQRTTDLPRLELIASALNPIGKDALAKLESEPKANELFVVYSDEESIFCRAKLIAQIERSKLVEVELIDYGNIIKASDLRILPVELHEVPALAVRCRLSGIPAESDINKVLAAEYFTSVADTHFGEYFEYEIVNEPTVGNDVLEINLKIDGKNLSTEFIEAIQSGVVPEVAVEPILHDCAIIQINSTGSFYLQKLLNTSEIESITYKLLDAETQYPIFSNIEIGAVCAAQFPDDGAFYRARILQIIEDSENDDGGYDVNKKCLVHFIDFGNDSISEQFRTLPDELLNQPHYGIHCALDTKFKDTDAATKYLQAYIDEHYSETFQIEFINQNTDDNQSSENPILCRLFHQTKNVATEIQTLIKHA